MKNAAHCKGSYTLLGRFLTDARFTDAVLSVNKPERIGSVMVFDRPWEGDNTCYFSILNDGDRYRMYYVVNSVMDPAYTEESSVCYAESTDGIHWVKPNLGMCGFRGSRDNNIILLGILDNFSVMIDENPACSPEHRYKAILKCRDALEYAYADPKQSEYGLVCMSSADGIHFRKYCVIFRKYACDSQNTVHWNPHLGRYFCYFRSFHDKDTALEPTLNEAYVRDIMVSESEDFIRWSEPKPLDFLGGEDYALYTNCVTAYPYDTRYYVGLPTRYVERKDWTANFDRLCGKEKRRERMAREKRLGTALTDCVFISSRDNVRWYRFDEACLTPGPEHDYNWVYGDCYPALGGLVETPSRFPGEPPEISIYAGCRHWMDVPVELERFVYRKDGFASYKAGYAAKTLITKPFAFEGDTLSVNFRTSARGGSM